MTSRATRAETEITVVVRSPDESRRELREVARALDAGARPDLPSRLSFRTMEQLLGVLTPGRWLLIERLHREGPMSIRALARALGRDYRGVHADVGALIAHDLVARDENRKIFVPWVKITAEISVAEEAA